MRTTTVELEIAFALGLHPNRSEAQIRSFLAPYSADADTYIAALVAQAPAAAQASLLDVRHRLQIDGVPGDGWWWLEVEIYVDVEVADQITDDQVWNYLSGFYDQGKARLRQLVAAVPSGAQANIQGWHVHRGLAPGDDESEA